MTFKQFLQASFTYFGKKMDLPKATGEMWEKDCGKYPGEFFEWAIEHIKSQDTGKNFLGNPPKAVRDLWFQWLQANPRKVEHKEFFCKEEHCKEGLLFVYKGKYRSAFRCEQCNASVLLGIPGSTAHKLILAGYVPETFEEIKARTVQCNPELWKKNPKEKTYERDPHVASIEKILNESPGLRRLEGEPDVDPFADIPF